MRTLRFAGQEVPAIGLGTWYMGEGRATRTQEVEAIRAGLDAGLRVVDTAEMYGDGAAEEVVGEALTGRRDDALLVSKVYPHHASRDGVRRACEDSLRRLRTDHLDVYLLHWRGQYPLVETVEGFEGLLADGLIASWGVSNLDPEGMSELAAVPGGSACVTDQILYNLTRRGPELDLMPMLSTAQVPVMAYSPLEQSRILDAAGSEVLEEVADRHGATPAQVALAWCVRDGDVLAIPKSASAERVRENAAAGDLELTEADLVALDEAFPAPDGPVPLETL